MFELFSLACLIAGAVLITQGWRGSPILSLPKCAHCKYDLRGIDPAVTSRCPECGNELNEIGAVSFGEYRRQPRRIRAGCVAVGVGMFVLLGWPIISRYDFRPNRVVVAKLTQTANQPWDWRELERRYRSGRLSGEQASEAIEQLIKSLNSRPAGQNQPLNWANDFLTLADTRGGISAEQYGRLAKAFYGPSPTIKMRPTAHPGDRLKFEIEYGGHWNLPCVELVKALRCVTVDGRELELLDESQTRPARAENLSQTGVFPINGYILQELPPGKHDLTFQIDFGLLPSPTSFRTTTGRPGQASRWPKPRHQWSEQINVPVEILATDKPLVSLETNESFNPGQGFRATASAHPGAGQDKTLLVIRIERSSAPSIPVIASATVAAGGEKTTLGHVLFQAGTSSNQIQSGNLPRLRPEVTTITLTLEPDPDYAERNTGVPRIWGKPVVIADIPLDREDLKMSPAR